VALNVGTGVAISVNEVVQHIIEYFSSASAVSITGAFREGDIRHNCASVERLRTTLGYQSKWRFEDGLRQFLEWTESQKLEARTYEQSLDEMRQKGLMHG
jgi:dTDP-L-rhamnose 4-epimerase